MITPQELKRLERKLLELSPLPKEMLSEIIGDEALSGVPLSPEDGKNRKAAVLIPLINRASGITVLLTKRTDHLPSHGGQVAFPGGKVEAHDQSIVHTALREAEEEVGLDKSFVNILGVLNDYQTGTGFDISPVVGLINDGFKLEMDTEEVSDIFEVPLEFVLNKQNHVLKSLYYKGADRTYYSIEYENQNIWGATAAILVNFCYVLRQYVNDDSKLRG